MKCLYPSIPELPALTLEGPWTFTGDGLVMAKVPDAVQSGNLSLGDIPSYFPLTGSHTNTSPSKPEIWGHKSWNIKQIFGKWSKLTGVDSKLVSQLGWS